MLVPVPYDRDETAPPELLGVMEVMGTPAVSEALDGVYEMPGFWAELFTNDETKIDVIIKHNICLASFFIGIFKK